jgi:hypothetical protein
MGSSRMHASCVHIRANRFREDIAMATRSKSSGARKTTGRVAKKAARKTSGAKKSGTTTRVGAGARKRSASGVARKSAAKRPGVAKKRQGARTGRAETTVARVKRVATTIAVEAKEGLGRVASDIKDRVT